MESPLPQINQTQAQEHEHNAKAPEPCIRHIQDLGYPEFHLLRKSKIRQPFDNHDHTQYTEKKIHQSINPFQFPEQKHPGTYCLPSTGASRQEFCATKKNSQTAPGAIWLPTPVEQSVNGHQKCPQIPLSAVQTDFFPDPIPVGLNGSSGKPH